MAVKPRNTVPAIKDRVTNFLMGLNPVPSGKDAILFLNPYYDYQVVTMGIYVAVATIATPVATFTLGHGAYTNSSGVVVPANTTKFLPAAACVGADGQPLGTTVMAAGTFVFFATQPDPTGQGLNILPAGAPLIVTAGTVGANTGTLLLSVALRPKEKDRNDASKRPSAAADQAFATYFK